MMYHSRTSPIVLREFLFIFLQRTLDYRPSTFPNIYVNLHLSLLVNILNNFIHIIECFHFEWISYFIAYLLYVIYLQHSVNYASMFTFIVLAIVKI